jgi:hypothetical protein
MEPPQAHGSAALVERCSMRASGSSTSTADTAHLAVRARRRDTLDEVEITLRAPVIRAMAVYHQDAF